MTGRLISVALEWLAAKAFRGVATCVCLVLLTACGGGGGGGSDSSDANESPFGIRVLHGSVDAAPVDFTALGDSTALIAQIVFAQSKGYRRAPVGSREFVLTRAFSPSQVVDTVTVDVDSGSRHTVLLYGDLETFGLRTAVIEDVVPGNFSGSLVRFVNATTGASALQAEIGGAVATVEFGKASSYLPVAPGVDLSVRVDRSVDGLPVVNTSVSLEEGRAYTFFVAGEVSYYVKGQLLRDH